MNPNSHTLFPSLSTLPFNFFSSLFSGFLLEFLCSLPNHLEFKWHFLQQSLAQIIFPFSLSILRVHVMRLKDAFHRKKKKSRGH